METLQLIAEIRKFLIRDVDYDFIPKENEYGNIGLASYIEFDIRNEIPSSSDIDYFQICSVDQAKDAFKTIYPRGDSDPDFDSKFARGLEETTFISNLPLYFAVYHVPRKRQEAA